MNVNNSENESGPIIQSQRFLNKSSLAEYSIICETLARIFFVHCNFEDI